MKVKELYKDEIEVLLGKGPNSDEIQLENFLNANEEDFIEFNNNFRNRQLRYNDDDTVPKGFSGDYYEYQSTIDDNYDDNQLLNDFYDDECIPEVPDYDYYYNYYYNDDEIIDD